VAPAYGRFQWNYCPICAKKLADADDGQGMRPYCGDCDRFYYSNPVPAACCFLENEKGGILFVQRSVEPRRGLWTFPGGFVELGETSDEAALRELEEETALKGSGTTLFAAATLARKQTGGVLVLGYRVAEWEGKMVADTDAMDLGFFTKEKRPELAFEVHMELLRIYDEITTAGAPWK